ncbi:hypothetical protein OCU04_011238 [Sclerotinia nivalis]|uniref:Uncharacterized protein n=1 Tax=Sclerotinia nivalis TaxID=352851 RepID=A0A9X0DG84_9HELO|nr:hypothetical protein OCU04_011238 [Sclerotinia nivalis]
MVGDKIVMVEDSETPGAKNLPLNSDHSGMVKYSSRSDELYEYVSDNIEAMVENLVERGDAVMQSSPISETQRRRGERSIHGPSAPRRKDTFLSKDEFEAVLF